MGRQNGLISGKETQQHRRIVHRKKRAAGTAPQHPPPPHADEICRRTASTLHKGHHTPPISLHSTPPLPSPPPARTFQLFQHLGPKALLQRGPRIKLLVGALGATSRHGGHRSKHRRRSVGGVAPGCRHQTSTAAALLRVRSTRTLSPSVVVVVGGQRGRGVGEAATAALAPTRFDPPLPDSGDGMSPPLQPAATTGAVAAAATVVAAADPQPDAARPVRQQPYTAVAVGRGGPEKPTYARAPTRPPPQGVGGRRHGRTVGRAVGQAHCRATHTPQTHAHTHGGRPASATGGGRLRQALPRSTPHTPRGTHSLTAGPPTPPPPRATHRRDAWMRTPPRKRPPAASQSRRSWLFLQTPRRWWHTPTRVQQPACSPPTSRLNGKARFPPARGRGCHQSNGRPAPHHPVADGARPAYPTTGRRSTPRDRKQWTRATG